MEGEEKGAEVQGRQGHWKAKKSRVEEGKDKGRKAKQGRLG